MKQAKEGYQKTETGLKKKPETEQFYYNLSRLSTNTRKAIEDRLKFCRNLKPKNETQRSEIEETIDELTNNPLAYFEKRLASAKKVTEATAIRRIISDLKRNFAQASEKIAEPQVSREDLEKLKADIERGRQEELENPEITDGKEGAVAAFKYWQGKMSAGDFIKTLGYYVSAEESAKKSADKDAAKWKPLFDRINAKYDAELLSLGENESKIATKISPAPETAPVETAVADEPIMAEIEVPVNAMSEPAVVEKAQEEKPIQEFYPGSGEKIKYVKYPGDYEAYFYENGHIFRLIDRDGTTKQYDENGILESKTFSDKSHTLYRPDGSWESFNPEGESLGRFDKEGKEIPPEPETTPAPEVAPDEKEKAKEELRKAIADAQAILEGNRIEREKDELLMARLRKQLEVIGEIKKGTQVSPEKSPGTKIFSTGEIEARIQSLLSDKEEIDILEKPKIEGKGKEITLTMVVRSSGFKIGIQATFENEENTIGLKSHYIDAMFGIKGKAEKELAPYLNKISEILKEDIEKITGKKIEKMEIENGELKVTFKQYE